MTADQQIQRQGVLIADYCQVNLGQGYSVKPSRSHHNQYEIFTDGYALRVGGFAFMGGVWIRLVTPLQPDNAPRHNPYFPIPPKECRDRAADVVSAAIRQFRDVKVAA